MHRIDTPTAQKDKFGAGKNGFTRGNPQTGTPATDLDDDYFDMLQEELAGVVEATGVSLVKSKHNQLLTALKALLLSRAYPFADIKADGPEAIAEALSNLGLTDLGIGKNIAGPNLNLLSSATSSGFYVYNGNTDPDFGIDYGMVLTLLYDSVSKQRVQIYLPLANTAGATPIIRVVTGNTTVWKYKLFSEKYKPTPADVGMGSGAPAIGVPFFWPSAAMPNTVISEWSDMVFLKFNGASFSAAAYPKLAQVLPGLTLPEARGEFPRIWDDGRGVDSGRALLSTQVDAIRNITGEVGFIQYFGNTTSSGALFSGGAQNLTNLQPGGNTVAQSVRFDASKDTSVSIANENRPRNIAFNFLVRAK
ncbi:phage tail protein [Citrobacter portucalensis]|uniref:phage tail protein n=1 Tax=Citrobacter portucalensis TaxID=1639133 RepID=UPI001F360C13